MLHHCEPRLRAGGLLLVAALALTGACQSETNGAGGPTSHMEGLDSPIVFGMVAFMSSSGVREGRIEADTAYTFADSSKVDLRGMTAVFFDENGRDRATVTGREGTWDQDTDFMVARGNVVLLVRTDGSKIESAEINYDPGRDRVWSDSATVRTLADGTAQRGSAFESDIDFTAVRVENVRGSTGRVFN